MLFNFSKFGYLIGKTLDENQVFYCGGLEYKNYAEKYFKIDFKNLDRHLTEWIQNYHHSLFKNIIY